MRYKKVLFNYKVAIMYLNIRDLLKVSRNDNREVLKLNNLRRFVMDFDIDRIAETAMKLSGGANEKFIPKIPSLDGIKMEQKFVDVRIEDALKIENSESFKWCICVMCDNGVITFNNRQLSLNDSNGYTGIVVATGVISANKFIVEHYVKCGSGRIALSSSPTVYKNLCSNNRMLVESALVPYEFVTQKANFYYIDSSCLVNQEADFISVEQHVYSLISSILMSVPKRNRGLYNSNELIAALEVANESLSEANSYIREMESTLYID